MMIALFGLLPGAGMAQQPVLNAPVTQVARAPVLPELPPVPVGPATPTAEQWNLHFQNTDIVQGDHSFPAKYSGTDSLSNKGQVQETVTADLFGGKRISGDSEAHFDLLMWQGYGLSETYGVESFPNGDAYKAGTYTPDLNFARLFLRKTIGLGGPREDVADDELTLAGAQDIKRLTITAGRFSPLDIVDNNVYASDPHTQFMSWAMMGNLTYDYGQDTIGYATGFSLDYNQPKWALRYGWNIMPRNKNGFTGDDQALMYPPSGAFGPLLKEWGMYSELERRYSVGAHPGKIRFMTWLDEADMANYRAAAANLESNPNDVEGDIEAARAFRYKYGFGLNWEQEIATNVGMFSRLGWNDGLEETWTYTDVSSSASVGVSVDGNAWRRPGDTFGLAGVISAASPENQRFLEAGGLDMLDGDGALTYGPEEDLETYYDHQICKGVHAALDYQYIENPAFNRDRGPVSVFGVRCHTEL